MRRFFFSAVAGLAAVSLGFAQDPVASSRPDVLRFRDALPTGTVAYLAAPDIVSSMERMQQMPLLRMWHEPEVQDFFAGLKKMIEQQWDEGLTEGRQAFEKGALPVNPDDLLKLRVHGVAFALTQLDMSVTDGEPMPRLGVVACIDCGDSAPTWRRLTEFGLGMLEKKLGDEAKRETFKVGDVEVMAFVPPVSDLSLNVAFVGDVILVGTLRDEMREVLDRMQSGKVAMPASANFKAAFAGLDSGNAEVEVFVQPGPMLDFALKGLQMAAEHAPDFPKEIDPAGVARAVEALGLRGCRAIAATTRYEMGKEGESARSVTKGFVVAPEGERRGIMGGSRASLDPTFLKWVPKDVASFNAVTFDLPAIHDGIVAAMKAYNEKMAEQLMGLLANYEQQFGVSIKDDLVGAFGDEFIMWSMPMAALGSMPEMAFLIKVRDEERLLKAMRKMAELSNGVVSIEESERRGLKVHQLQINFDPSGGNGFNPLDMFVPTFAFKDGYLVAGLSTGDIKRVFKRMEREDDPSSDIRGNAEFKRYADKFPKNVSTLGFSDWKANFEGIYQLLTSLTAFVPVSDEIPIDLSLLPDVSSLTKHLFGSVSWSWSDADGSHSMGVSPWGPETIAISLGAVGAGAAFVGVRASAEHR